MTAINPVFVLSSRLWRNRGERLEVRGSIRILVSQFLLSQFSSFPPPFASFRVFRGPKCIGTAQTNLTTDFTDPIWIKDRSPLPQIHPDPILPPSVVKTSCSIWISVSRFLLSHVSFFPSLLGSILRLLRFLWPVRNQQPDLILNLKLKLAPGRGATPPPRMASLARRFRKLVLRE